MDTTKLKCEFCPTMFSQKGVLKRHYQAKHGEIPPSFFQLSDAKSSCKFCGLVVLSVHLARHENTACTLRSSGIAQAGPLSSQAGPSTRRRASTEIRPPPRNQHPPPPSPTSPSAPSNLFQQVNKPKPVARADEDIFEEYKLWMIEVQRLKENTAAQYITQMKRFERFWLETKPHPRRDFPLNEVGKIHYAEPPLHIPSPTDWVRSLPYETMKDLALNAYTSFCNYLKCILNDNWTLYLDEKDCGERYTRLKANKDQAKSMRKAYNNFEALAQLEKKLIY